MFLRRSKMVKLGWNQIMISSTIVLLFSLAKKQLKRDLLLTMHFFEAFLLELFALQWSWLVTSTQEKNLFSTRLRVIVLCLIGLPFLTMKPSIKLLTWCKSETRTTQRRHFLLCQNFFKMTTRIFTHAMHVVRFLNGLSPRTVSLLHIWMLRTLILMRMNEFLFTWKFLSLCWLSHATLFLFNKFPQYNLLTNYDTSRFW